MTVETRCPVMNPQREVLFVMTVETGWSLYANPQDQGNYVRL